MSEDVVQGGAARRPGRVTLRGRLVDVVPLDGAAHARSLYAGVSGPRGDALWTYMFDGPFDDFEAFRESLAKKAGSADPLFFAIVDKASAEAVGMAAYLRMEPVHRVIEVGNIVFTPRLQRHAGGTEAMYLMARYVFEELGYRRYEWKCNALNAPSRAAALRFGFSFEGIFRQHMIVKGRNRDTAWFAMMDHEWPERKAAFEAWLAPSNFDEAGNQRAKLGRT